jgi:predicted 3-demethylubiquinone-9 3-methyltransferase (glyoxalase superfamily)
LWDRLSAGSAIETFGWLKDRYGVCWQIAPDILPKLLADPNRAKARCVMAAMLQMVKIDIAGLRRTYDGV